MNSIMKKRRNALKNNKLFYIIHPFTSLPYYGSVPSR